MSWDYLGHLAIRIAVVYLILLVVLMTFQRNFLYFPTRDSFLSIQADAQSFGLVPWEVNGKKIGWKSANPPASTEYRVLVFHGNGGMAANRHYYLRPFEQTNAAMAFEVYILEYPGYGAREGVWSERSFIDAGLEAFDALDTNGARVYLVGESLGSGVACAVAQMRPDQVCGMLLVTPFCSVVRVAAAGPHRIFPVEWMVWDRFDNESALQSYKGPVAFLVAGRDHTIPTSEQMRLARGYKNGAAKIFEQPNAGHNSISLHPTSPMWEQLMIFWSMQAR